MSRVCWGIFPSRQEQRRYGYIRIRLDSSTYGKTDGFLAKRIKSFSASDSIRPFR